MEVEVLQRDIALMRDHLNSIAEAEGLQTALIAVVTLVIEQMKLNVVSLVRVSTVNGDFEGCLLPTEH